MYTAIRFGEDDVRIKEGISPRAIAVERVDVSEPVWITVNVTTIKEYKQHQLSASGCNLTLDDLGVNETLVDPAESNSYCV